MRVGLVAHELAGPGRHGGVGRCVRAHGEELARHGHAVAAFVPGPSAATVHESGIDVTYAQIAPAQLETIVDDPSVDTAFITWLEQFQPDVVHIHHLFHLSARLPQLCVELGVPYVLHVHDAGLACHNAHLMRQGSRPDQLESCAGLDECSAALALRCDITEQHARKIMELWRLRGRQTVEQAHHVVYVSSSLQATFESDLGWRARDARVMRPALSWPIPTGDTRDQSVTRFGTFGVATPVKGIDRLVRAFARAEGPAELHLHGDIVAKEQYRALLADLIASDPRIVVHGAYEPHELAGLMGSLDWVVIPSHYESSSLVLDEAHALGVPVIAADVGGMSEKLSGGGGLLVDAANTEAFAATLDTASSEQVRENAARTIQAPPVLGDQIHELVALYDPLVARHSVPQTPAAARAPREGEPKAALTSIIMLTFNEVEYTQRCVDSIRTHTPEPYELIFVDNGSTDGTLEYLQTLDDAIVIANEHNVGFGGGCNQGLAVARGEQLLLINNDAVVTDGWMTRLQDGLSRNPSFGMACPRTNNIAGAQQVHAVSYDEESLHGLAQYSATRAQSFAGRGRELQRAVGFCMLFDRRVLDDVGGFDVRFSLGNLEDDDFCLRVRLAGHRIWQCDDAFVHHFGSRTFTANGMSYVDTMSSNWEKFCRKWSIAPHMLDAARTGYVAERVLEQARYDFALHYAPLVAQPHSFERVLFERRATTVLVLGDPLFPADLEEAFDACCVSYAGRDDVTIAVRVAAADTESLLVLEQVAERYSNLPDVVVVPSSPLNDETLIAACDAVVCHGRKAAATAGVARLQGTDAVSLPELRASARAAA